MRINKLRLVKTGLCSVTDSLHGAVILLVTGGTVCLLESGDDKSIIDPRAEIVVGSYIRSISYQARPFGTVRHRDMTRNALYVAALMVRAVMDII